MTDISREDWVEVKETAENQIKQAKKVLELQGYILEVANKKLSSMPKTKEDAKQKLY